MSLFLHLQEERYQLGVWKIEESLTELLDFFPQNHEISQEIICFKSQQRALEWVAVRMLLYRLLGNIPIIRYLESGKPYLTNGNYISISHTKGYVAVIIGNISEVGIDIEYFSNRVKKVASRFMRKDEQIVFYNGDDIWNYLIHWSAKETMFKCIDDIEIDFKNHMHLEKFEISDSGVFTAYEYKTPFKKIFRIHYLLNPDFVMTWTIDSNEVI